ncbi:MAG TPA: TonB-dependent receptor [Candidatus Cloacimonadota bacterium]|nr:TonB-dependent receptor [Candidatus Cloacimonadota bacterium]
MAPLHAYWIKGIVKDTDGKPIPQVWVESLYNTVSTDSLGMFSWNIITTNKSLYFYKIGYKGKSVSFEKYDELNVITLEKNPVPLPGVHVEGQSYPGQLSPMTELKSISILDNRISTLPEILIKETNAMLTGTPLTGEKQTISLLGFKDRHISVLLDGIPINNAGEDFDLSTIPLESLEKVELIENNTSSISGSGGMGGTLNLVTKQWGSEGLSSFETSFSSGSYGLQKRLYRSFLTTPVLQTMFLYSRQEADNDFKYKSNSGDYQIRKDNHKFVRNYMLQTGLVDQNWNFHYLCDFQDFNKELPGPVNFLLVYQDARLTGDVLRQSLEANQASRYGKFHLSIYQNKENTVYDNTHATLPVYSMQSRNTLHKSGLQSSYDLNWNVLKSHSLFEFWKENFTYREPTSPQNDIPEKSQQLVAAGQQIEYAKETSTFLIHGSINGRIDHHETFDHFSTYRFAGDTTYKTWCDMTIGGSYGTGFTVPAFYSLYWKGDAQAIGNTDLKPERSEGWQIFGKIKYDYYSFSATYHQNELKDMILWIQTYQWGGVWKPVNIAQAQMKTLICEGSANPLSILTITGSYTHTTAIDRSLLPDGSQSAFYGQNLVYLPRDLFRLGVLIDLNREYFHLFYHYTGKQWTKTDNLLPPLKAYGIFDAETGVQFQQGKWQENISLMTNNILNHRYEIYPYIPQPGFNWQIQMNIKYTLHGGKP